jgi:quinol-cytochrome oxidoreductase complex cytochrome b subunit
MFSTTLYIVTLITLFMCFVWTASTHNTPQTQQTPDQSSKYVLSTACKVFPQEMFLPFYKLLQLTKQSSRHVTSVTTAFMNSPKNASTTFKAYLVHFSH